MSGLSIYLWGERWVSPLPDEASRTKLKPEKKDPLRGSFFLPAFGRCCPSPLGQCLPAQQVTHMCKHKDTCTTHNTFGFNFSLRHAWLGVRPRYRMTYPLMRLDPLVRWYRMPSTIAKNRHLRSFCGTYHSS